MAKIVLLDIHSRKSIGKKRILKVLSENKLEHIPIYALNIYSSNTLDELEIKYEKYYGPRNTEEFYRHYQLAILERDRIFDTSLKHLNPELRELGRFFIGDLLRTFREFQRKYIFYRLYIAEILNTGNFDEIFFLTDSHILEVSLREYAFLQGLKLHQLIRVEKPIFKKSKMKYDWWKVLAPKSKRKSFFTDDFDFIFHGCINERQFSQISPVLTELTEKNKKVGIFSNSFRDNLLFPLSNNSSWLSVDSILNKKTLENYKFQCEKFCTWVDTWIYPILKNPGLIPGFRPQFLEEDIGHHWKRLLLPRDWFFHLIALKTHLAASQSSTFVIVNPRDAWGLDLLMESSQKRNLPIFAIIPFFGQMCVPFTLETLDQFDCIFTLGPSIADHFNFAGYPRARLKSLGHPWFSESIQQKPLCILRAEEEGVWLFASQNDDMNEEIYLMLEKILIIFPKKRLVIRLHPTEKQPVFLSKIKSMKNFSFCKNKTITESLDNVELFFSSSSSTIIHAIRREIPVILFDLGHSPIPSFFTLEKVGAIISSQNELLTTLKKIYCDSTEAENIKKSGRDFLKKFLTVPKNNPQKSIAEILADAKKVLTQNTSIEVQNDWQ